MWYIILGLLALVYITINYILSGTYIEVYLIRPLLWISLALTTFFIAKNQGVNFLKFKKIRRWNLGKNPIQSGLLLGAFQVALLIIIGIFFSFGSSPYARTPLPMLQNAFYIGALLVGTEFSRAYILKKAVKNPRKYQTLAIILTTLLYVVILTSPSKFANFSLNDPVKTLEFLGGTIIVALAINLLATYLAYLGGATASLSYMGTLLAFEWFSPVLPNPHWIVLALAGTLAPAIGFIILQDSVLITNKKTSRKSSKRYKTDHGWTSIAIFSIIIIFFSYGYLGIQPTVIYSGSMQPTYNVGDIVFVSNVEISQIHIGDPIQYVAEDNILIIHRVIERYQDENNQLFFITQGDANDNPDPHPVLHQNVQGKVTFKIPLLGWVQIYTKSFFQGITAPFRQ